MGQRVKVELYDDIEDGDATNTVAFGWDGKSYEIDLNDKNYQAFKKAVQKYVEHARVVRTAKPGRRLHAVQTAPDAKAVRAWAQSQGIEVNRLGKVPQAIVDQFVAAGN